MSDKCCINLVCQVDGINFLFFKHVNILRLCYLICDIENIVFIFFFTSFKIIWKCNIFALHVLEDDVIFHLIVKFLVTDAAKLNEWADVIPVFFIVFTIGLAHAGKLFRHFLSDVVRNFLNKTVIL